jgi:hypothetical protein
LIHQALRVQTTSSLTGTLRRLGSIRKRTSPSIARFQTAEGWWRDVTEEIAIALKAKK